MWVYIPIFEILFGIVGLGVCYLLFKKFWQFRVILATAGILLSLSLPVASIFLAYISITKENLIIVAIIQLILGWTIGAVPLYFFMKPYLKYIKEKFDGRKNN